MVGPHQDDLSTLADDTIGRVIDGRYEVLRILGEGGLGRVYAALDQRLGRQVALKVLLAEHAETPSLRGRFEREAKALSALSHPNIVTITDFGLDGERAFVVMELLVGQDLSSLLSGRGLEPPRAVAIARGVLSALSHAHALSIVHRDLKPSNVMVRQLPDGSEHVAVLDFGLAKFLDDTSSTEGAQVAPITRTGAMLGTPAYMSPEQACGVPADTRSDVYSAGLLLFELLVGTRPFADVTGPALLKKRLVEAPPPLSQAAPHWGAQPGLEGILRTALHREVEHRYADAGEMLRALDALPAPLGRVSLTGSESTPIPQPEPAGQVGAFAATMQMPHAGVAPVPQEPNPVPLARQSAQATLRARPRPEPIPSAHSGQPGQPGQLATAPQASHYASQHASLESAPVTLPLQRSNVWMWMLGLGALGALGLVVVGGIAYVLWGTDEPIPVAAPETTPAPAPLAPPTPPRPTRPPARDPWRTAPPQPDVVTNVRERLDRNGEPSRRALRVLAGYAGNHPQDPLPRLLLARAFGSKGWLTDALPYLNQAFELDLSVRGDPHALPTLMRAMQSDAHHAEAARVIARVYGREALPSVTEALASRRTGADARARLEALQRELNAAPE